MLGGQVGGNVQLSRGYLGHAQPSRGNKRLALTADAGEGDADKDDDGPSKKRQMTQREIDKETRDIKELLDMSAQAIGRFDIINGREDMLKVSKELGKAHKALGHKNNKILGNIRAGINVEDIAWLDAQHKLTKEIDTVGNFFALVQGASRIEQFHTSQAELQKALEDFTLNLAAILRPHDMLPFTIVISYRQAMGLIFAMQGKFEEMYAELVIASKLRKKSKTFDQIVFAQVAIKFVAKHLALAITSKEPKPALQDFIRITENVPFEDTETPSRSMNVIALAIQLQEVYILLEPKRGTASDIRRAVTKTTDENPPDLLKVLKSVAGKNSLKDAT
jgi:hypothetical protein